MRSTEDQGSGSGRARDGTEAGVRRRDGAGVDRDGRRARRRPRGSQRPARLARDRRSTEHGHGGRKAPRETRVRAHGQEHRRRPAEPQRLRGGDLLFRRADERDGGPATGDGALGSGREHRLSFYTLLACPDESRACRFSEGPSWRITLTGRAENNTAFTAPIELMLPTDANVPIVRRERVLVRRVPSGPDPARVPATFKPGVILVPASVNGHDVTLLFDTGSQVCLLSPEVARR